VEATAFGSLKIMERYKEAGIPMKQEIIAMGGVAKKSPLVMQTLADVLNCPVKTVRSGNVCALGAAMFAAVAAGIHASVQVAQKKMGSGFDLIYYPIPENVPVYQQLYDHYKKLGSFYENF
jgi:L-ribulokinase